MKYTVEISECGGWYQPVFDDHSITLVPIDSGFDRRYPFPGYALGELFSFLNSIYKDYKVTIKPYNRD